ncbi:hypothetical protein L1987_18910 [Smallanthus sonchifolius]|uniref:Uncharacterized protein n=1 Tax=Smallanthus sonchifolius TaxID=185202 RepID=A0ACB9J121_9ASTR|nr:hypothetical protein L1987_18910 [Smallanthus sonchifolius]
MIHLPEVTSKLIHSRMCKVMESFAGKRNNGWAVSTGTPKALLGSLACPTHGSGCLLLSHSALWSNMDLAAIRDGDWLSGDGDPMSSSCVDSA